MKVHLFKLSQNITGDKVEGDQPGHPANFVNTIIYFAFPYHKYIYVMFQTENLNSTNV